MSRDRDRRVWLCIGREERKMSAGGEAGEEETYDANVVAVQQDLLQLRGFQALGRVLAAACGQCRPGRKAYKTATHYSVTSSSTMSEREVKQKERAGPCIVKRILT